MNAQREKVLNLLQNNVQRTRKQINSLVNIYLCTQEEFETNDLFELTKVLDKQTANVFSVRDTRVNAAFEFEAYVRNDNKLLDMISAVRKSSIAVSHVYMKMLLYTHLMTGGCPFDVFRVFFLWDGQMTADEITDCTNLFMQYDWTADTICNLVEKNINVTRLLPELIRLQKFYEGTVQFNPAWVRRVNAKLTLRNREMLSIELPEVPTDYHVNRTIFSVERSWSCSGKSKCKSSRQRLHRRD